MLDDNSMLTYIMQNAEMGCCGISCIKNYAQSENMKKALRTQMIEYGKIYSCANHLLKENNDSANRVSPMVRKMTRYTAKRQMEKDNSDSHIAKVMINGNTRGVSKIVEHICDYDSNNSKVQNLARKLLETEQNNIVSMSSFI